MASDLHQNISQQDRDVQVFIRCVRHYFETVTGTKDVSIEPPFLKDGEDVVLGFTGIIGISGEHKGAIFVSCAASMLDALLRNIGEAEPDVELRQDMVGEIANTISGNLRREFGKNFLISVPIVVRGAGVVFPKSTRNIVIPLNWQGSTASVIVCLE
jgi:chemotaxis protein CheX